MEGDGEHSWNVIDAQLPQSTPVSVLENSLVFGSHVRSTYRLRSEKYFVDGPLSSTSQTTSQHHKLCQTQVKGTLLPETNLLEQGRHSLILQPVCMSLTGPAMLQLLDVDVSQIGPRGPVVESVRTFIAPQHKRVHVLQLPMRTVNVRDARRDILTSPAKLEARRCAASLALWVHCSGSRRPFDEEGMDASSSY